MPGEDSTEVVGRRIGALLIDSVLFAGLFVILAVATGGAESSDGSARVNLTGGPFVLFLAIMLAYFVICEGTSGQTLGKHLLRIRVVSDDGSRAGWGQVIGRNLLRVVDSLPIFYLVGLISVVATGERRKRIGDLAAGTRVVAAP
jgi:uncharacterized RDD family membrane protein YckC